MAFIIRYNEEKNELLKVQRGVNFIDVKLSIKMGKVLADIGHPNKNYTNQKIYVVEIEGYAYAVPYVIDLKKQEIFLKTVYPSRTLTKKYLRGGNK